jgi:signal transduction histidine kinase/DNA-binding response OmpR family regulator
VGKIVSAFVTFVAFTGDFASNFVGNYIYSEGLSLEARRINMIYTVGVATALFALILRIIMGAPIVLIAIIVAIITIVILMMVLSNAFNLFKPLTWVTSIIICLVFFPAIFFFIGGLDGTGSAYFVLSATIIFFLHRGKGRVIMLLIEFAITGLCIILGELHPDWVVLLQPWQQAVDGFFSYAVIACCIGSILGLLSSIYENERNRAQESAKLQTVVNESARLLLTAKTDNLTMLISEAMGVIGSMLDIDRMYVWRHEQIDGSLCYVQEFGWTGSKEFAESSLKSRSNTTHIKSISVWEKRFQCNIVTTGPVSSLTIEEQEILSKYDVKSVLVMPVYRDDAFIGFVSFDDCRNENHMFTDDVVKIFRSISSMIFSAITRNAAEKEVADALAQAEQASKAKGDFLSNMSHEMRTPMNAIIGMTSIGRQANNIERKDYALEKIDDASAHLLGLINDILDMSKIEAGKLELCVSDFEFERMLRKVVNVINFRVEQRHQHFFVTIDNRIPKQLVGDDQRLAQVITNLLSNAVKFTEENGSIHLNATLANDKCSDQEDLDYCIIRVEIKDTGIGISEEQQTRLFRSFEQAESGTSRKFGGTGLGLAISKRIVELMEGKIWVESELGKGSTFIFTVRLKRSSQNLCDKSSPIINWNNLRLLVVDNEQQILDYFTDFGKQNGIHFDVCNSGEAALTIIDNDISKYDMFLIDFSMPNMNGLQLSQHIRDLGSNAPITMISASDWSDIQPQAQQIGNMRYLAKPLFPSSILDLLTECFGKSHAKGQTDKSAKGSRNHQLCTDNKNDSAGKCDMPCDSNMSSDSSGTVQDNIWPDDDVLASDITILLAEDIAINQEIVIALLEPSQMQIIVAEDGEDVLEKFSLNPKRYDVILMDVQMPKMNGLDATRAIRALDDAWAKRIPIIAMTANVFKEDVENCLAAGMDDHLGKPLDLSELLGKLRFYLRDKKLKSQVCENDATSL